MTLSSAAKLYLTWQVFDKVNREPTRLSALPDEIPGLLAWPDFRQDVMNDPRFLVVGDFLDVATVGIPANSSVDKIITATLERARMPMRDHDLERIVLRLRPTLPIGSDIIGQAVRSADLFRPRTGHLARRRWLAGAKPLSLPANLPDDPLGAAESYLQQVGNRVNAVSLAASLAERFGLTISEAYAVAVDPTFLPLPDGTVCLYLPVEDEITAALEALETGMTDPDLAASETVDEVALADLEESAPIPADLEAAVVRLCRERRGPVTTAFVLENVVRVAEEDARYLVTYWTVNRRLGLAPQLMAVGEHLWIDTASVPGEVFRRPIRNPQPPGPVSQGSGESPSTKTVLRKPLSDGRPKAASLVLSEPEVRSGCVSRSLLGLLLPDHPLIQFVRWNGQPAWYNADTHTLVGLGPWLGSVGAAPGDTLQLRVSGTSLDAVLRPSARHALLSAVPVPRVVRRQAGRNLYTAVVDVLNRVGGVLGLEELVELLRESDPREWGDLDWAEVEPLFHRYPALKLAGDLCVLVSLAGTKSGNGNAADAETLVLLDSLADRHEHLRDDPDILRLITSVAGSPRATGSRQTVLVARARRWLKGWGAEQESEALEELIGAFRRMVVRQLLIRKDLEDILPWLDDLFQEGCRGLLRGIQRYDPDRGNLASALGYSVFSAINRAKPEIVHSIRFPSHVYARIEKAAEALRQGREPEDQEAASLSAWEFVPWDECLAAYEEGGLPLEPLTMGPPEPCPVSRLEQRQRRATVLSVLESLAPREEEVIRQRFGFDGEEPRTLEEVGLHFGVTRERIRQIEVKAFNRLRHSSRIRVLREVR